MNIVIFYLCLNELLYLGNMKPCVNTEKNPLHFKGNRDEPGFFTRVKGRMELPAAFTLVSRLNATGRSISARVES